MSEKAIADYAVIGDGGTAALVHRTGTIEWLCLPRFDSDACLAALLGDDENGSWRIAPVGEVTRTERRYRGDSLILETDLVCESGMLRLIDFMPQRGEAPDLVRIAECIEGTVDLVSELCLRFDFGRIHPLVHSSSPERSVAISGPDAVSLDFDAPIEFENRQFTSRVTLARGERSCFVLTWFASHEQPPERVDPLEALAQTEAFWARWVQRVTYDGAYRGAVVRSLITLKALVHSKTGGIVAAPTSSLPEMTGGERNWDYRYCWVRDATFTLIAFIRSGLRAEAQAWLDWLHRAIGGEPVEVRPCYAVDGDNRLFEWNADWLSGFNGARPVRFGNGAEAQLQLDIYGEVMDALYVARQNGLADGEASDQLVRLLAEKLERLWQQPDAGIWESRGPLRHHTYSKVMCWVAFDRAAQWFARSDAALARRYAKLAETVRVQVLEQGVDAECNAFVRAFDDPSFDAATLRIPLVGFLPATDPRMIATVGAVERNLLQDGLLRRYATDETDDGLKGGEGAFVAASNWLVEVLFLQGRHSDAALIFERLLARANELGLLAEELSTADERQLGNFPQGLSHLSLINAAHRMAGQDCDRRAAPTAVDHGSGFPAHV